MRICPDHQLIVIARDDDTTFRILHSRFHELWSLRLCTWLGKGNDPRYTPSTIFETFPFPAGLTPNAPAADYPGISFQIPMATGRPEIFNTDQGAQFTSDAFTSLLRAAEVPISMDGRGRALDNVFVERLWRSVKYEEVYLKDYGSVPEVRAGLGRYFAFYNQERLSRADQN